MLVYNYMLQSFPVQREAKYTAHKRSELKRVYNSIVNLSKASPYYKVNLSRENQEYTIGVKETALGLKAKLRDMSDATISGFQSKALSVSDKNVLTAELTDGDTEGLPEHIRFNVKTLASEQINRGRELMNTSKGLPYGEYEFLAKVMDETYRLTFAQEERTENSTTLKNMADFLNQSIPGINVIVERGTTKDYSRLAIVSERTGKYGERNFFFEDIDIFHEGIVDFFGLNRMDQAPENAQFNINGVEKQTTSNTFTLENKLKITLHNPSEQPVDLNIIPDSEKILSSVASVLSTYNNLIRLAKDRTIASTEHYRAEKLMNDMKGIEALYQEELEACGIKALEDGRLVIDDALAVQAAEDGGMESLFTRENGFIARLLDKAENIAINPMDYLDKIIVTYPNKGKQFPNPYVTSMYSGLLFNSYC